jgi:hypothetical protein
MNHFDPDLRSMLPSSLTRYSWPAPAPSLRVSQLAKIQDLKTVNLEGCFGFKPVTRVLGPVDENVGSKTCETCSCHALGDWMVESAKQGPRKHAAATRTQR